MTGVIHKAGEDIVSLEDWYRLAGPKRSIQWQDHRSAKESAKAWLGAGTAIPAEILNTLRSHPDIGDFVEWRAEPEALVRFDSFRGEPANIDMLLIGQDASGPVVVVVEAKADETFGYPLQRTLENAQARLKKSSHSKGVERIDRITHSLFGVAIDDSTISELRYQLMTASAAAIAEAERVGASRALLLVHEFITIRTDDSKRRSNATDLSTYVSRIAGSDIEIEDGRLIGPLDIPGKPICESQVRLYVGKSIRDARKGVA